MSLFGSIQMGATTLQAMQIGLQVVGNNIANANTPGYIRQETIYSPAPVQRTGDLILGLGVEVDSIVQKIDRFVLERLAAARGDRANAEVQEQTYSDIEVLLNELSSDTDLSSALTGFFDSIDGVLNDPGNAATRSLVVQKGLVLTESIDHLNEQATAIQQELDDRVVNIADDINSLAEQIRVLNLQIATTEGGDASGSVAGGLRVQRQAAIDSLSELIGIRVIEQPSGGVNVAVGGEFIVFEGQRREVGISQSDETGTLVASVQFVDTKSDVVASSGELAGLYAARDGIVGDFLNSLDNVAGTLIFEFNKLYSQGQGQVGFDQLTAASSVSDADAAIDAAGLSFTPVHGAFDVLVHNKDSDLTTTHTIQVDLDGLDEDSSLNDLAAQLDAIDGLTASVSSTGTLRIGADSADTEFYFAGDTSGVLAALGLNTFFTGSSASDIGVNDELKGISNARKFAASLGGIGQSEDTANVERLAIFLDQPLQSAGGASLSEIYDQLINEITQSSSIAQSVADGFRSFEATLDSQNQAISGVSLDEEAVKMITLQRVYQATAKFIQTISEMLDILMDL
jgi:flagellar hook-associated protein 1 FlgK